MGEEEKEEEDEEDLPKGLMCDGTTWVMNMEGVFAPKLFPPRHRYKSLYAFEMEIVKNVIQLVMIADILFIYTSKTY